MGDKGIIDCINCEVPHHCRSFFLVLGWARQGGVGGAGMSLQLGWTKVGGRTEFLLGCNLVRQCRGRWGGAGRKGHGWVGGQLCLYVYKTTILPVVPLLNTGSRFTLP